MTYSKLPGDALNEVAARIAAADLVRQEIARLERIVREFENGALYFANVDFGVDVAPHMLEVCKGMLHLDSVKNLATPLFIAAVERGEDVGILGSAAAKTSPAQVPLRSMKNFDGISSGSVSSGSIIPSESVQPVLRSESNRQNSRVHDSILEASVATGLTVDDVINKLPKFHDVFSSHAHYKTVDNTVAVEIFGVRFPEPLKNKAEAAFIDARQHVVTGVESSSYKGMIGKNAWVKKVYYAAVDFYERHLEGMPFADDFVADRPSTSILDTDDLFAFSSEEVSNPSSVHGADVEHDLIDDDISVVEEGVSDIDEYEDGSVNATSDDEEIPDFYKDDDISDRLTLGVDHQVEDNYIDPYSASGPSVDNVTSAVPRPSVPRPVRPPRLYKVERAASDVSLESSIGRDTDEHYTGRRIGQGQNVRMDSRLLADLIDKSD